MTAPLTTAKARALASRAASRLNWEEAARLLRIAIDAYPLPADESRYGALARNDIAQMQAKADRFERLSKIHME